MQTSSNYQPKSICFKGKNVASVYDKTWCTAIVQNVDHEQVDTSMQFMHPNGFSSLFWSQKDDICLMLTQRARHLIGTIESTMAKISSWLLLCLLKISNKDNEEI